MKITVVNGTSLRGITYKLKEIFLDNFRGNDEITEFFLPRDCPDFCAGCKTCFLHDENKCKDRKHVEIIENAMLEADLLVFTTPSYVFHATGAMKVLLDHFGYRWIPHRPAKEMFLKRAVIITQCLGAGGKSAAKDIKDSLSWWGVSDIRTLSFKLMSDVIWDKIPENRRKAMKKKIDSCAKKTLDAFQTGRAFLLRPSVSSFLSALCRRRSENRMPITPISNIGSRTAGSIKSVRGKNNYLQT